MIREFAGALVQKCQEGRGQDQIVKNFFRGAYANCHSRGLGRKSFERVAVANLAAAGANIVSGAIVEIGERNAGNAMWRAAWDFIDSRTTWAA